MLRKYRLSLVVMLWKDIWLRWNAFDGYNYYVQKFLKKTNFNNHKKFSSRIRDPQIASDRYIASHKLWPTSLYWKLLNNVCKTDSVMVISIIFMKFHEFLMRCTVVKHVKIPSIESTNPNPLTWLVFDSVQHIIFLEFKIISKDKQTRKRLWIRIFEPKR